MPSRWLPWPSSWVGCINAVNGKLTSACLFHSLSLYQLGPSRMCFFLSVPLPVALYLRCRSLVVLDWALDLTCTPVQPQASSSVTTQPSTLCRPSPPVVREARHERKEPILQTLWHQCASVDDISPRLSVSLTHKRRRVPMYPFHSLISYVCASALVYALSVVPLCASLCLSVSYTPVSPRWCCHYCHQPSASPFSHPLCLTISLWDVEVQQPNLVCLANERPGVLQEDPSPLARLKVS